MGPGIQRIDFRQARWPLHGTAATREIEAQVALALEPHALMAAAGLSVARLAMALAPHASQIQVWAGPGNNGGDGLVAARHLHLAGRKVKVFLLGDATSLPLDAAWALREAQAAGVPLTSNGPDQTNKSAGSGLLIDALLGLGVNRAPAGPIAEAIRAINSSDSTVLAVDLPSGLQSDTGLVFGGAAVKAAATLALLTLKPGCHTASGRDHAGDVWFDALGVAAADPDAWLCADIQRAPREFSAHKGCFGDVVVIGGASGMQGAAWLAAHAALAAGAGRVICSPLEDEASLIDWNRPELMGRRAWWMTQPAELERATVVCGCGGGKVVSEVLPGLLSHVKRLVLDADALNAVAGDAGLQRALCARRNSGQQTVLTPHPLEAARLLSLDSSTVQRDRLAAASALASKFNATVVLKGSGSVLATPGLAPRINATGNAALSTAGTGDVLAGWLGGLWAQAATAAPIDIATLAVGMHGAAADAWLSKGRHGPLLASDLIRALALR
jgi:hydroxyethylthiazole kinase-like uncharacterized protein yjeF